jgi:hypothetical protein
MRSLITIDLGTLEFYDSTTNQFEYLEGGVVRFEYSLTALYNWEGKWKRPFLKGNLSSDEAIDFYKCMALDPIDERFLSAEVMNALSDYIDSSNTATTFSSGGHAEDSKATKGKIYTAEELYALMFMAGVDISMETRNLNRLMVMLKIVASYNNPPKKMSKEEIFRQNAKLNAERKAQMKTKG